MLKKRLIYAALFVIIFLINVYIFITLTKPLAPMDQDYNYYFFILFIAVLSLIMTAAIGIPAVISYIISFGLMDGPKDEKKKNFWFKHRLMAVCTIIILAAVTPFFAAYILKLASQETVVTPANYRTLVSQIASPSAQITPVLKQPKLTIYSLFDEKVETLLKTQIDQNPHFGVIAPKIHFEKGFFYYGDRKNIYRNDLNVDVMDFNASSTPVYYSGKDKQIANFDLSRNGAFLYITLMKDYEANEGAELELMEYNISTKESRLIIKQKPVLYGNLSYIGRAGAKDIVGTFGGDGCGGYGEIYSVENLKVDKVLETGAGCVDKPRYIGYDEDKNALILASAQINNKLNPGDSNFIEYDKLYYQDAINQNIELIADLKDLSFSEYSLELSKNKNALVWIKDKKIYFYDLSQKKIENTVDLGLDKSISLVDILGWPYGSEIFIKTGQNRFDKVYSVNLFSGVKKEVGNAIWDNYIGEYNGRDYFFTTEYN